MKGETPTGGEGWYRFYGMGPSTRACKCRNAGRKFTEFYCWGRCKNRGQLMPSPNMARGLLGHFPRCADPPATDQRASSPPVQSPTSLSLREILEAGARGGGARGGAGGRKSLRDGGGGGGGAGGRIREIRWAMSSEVEAENRKTATMKTTVARASK